MSAHRRLLDLLSGWVDHADACDEAHKKKPHPGVGPDEYRREADSIARLYQEAGPDMTPEDVETFVRERVLPLLVRGPQCDEP